MSEWLKPYEIDYDLMALDDTQTDDGLTVVIDAEGEEVFYTHSLEMAQHLVKLLNLAEDIVDVVRQNQEAFTATPAGDSRICGERWPPAGNDQRTHSLERVLAFLQNALEKK